MTAVIKNDTGDSSGTKLWRGDRMGQPRMGQKRGGGTAGERKRNNTLKKMPPKKPHTGAGEGALQLRTCTHCSGRRPELTS